MQFKSRVPRTGFTLLELMIVVAIVGILAATSSLAFSTYIKRSKTGEAPTLLKHLAESQTSFRARPRYNQVTGAEETPCWVYSLHHPAAVGAAKSDWGGTDAYNILGFGASGQVYYSYGINAHADTRDFGDGHEHDLCTVVGSTVTSSGSPEDEAAVIAWGDLTGDAVYSTFARFMYGAGSSTELGGLVIEGELE